MHEPEEERRVQAYDARYISATEKGYRVHRFVTEPLIHSNCLLLTTKFFKKKVRNEEELTEHKD